VYLVWGVGWADGLPLEAEAAPIRRRGQDPQMGPLTVLPILDGSNHTAGKREASDVRFYSLNCPKIMEERG
jgi:hypothetical protein